jgi:hypothetical protein
MIYLLRAALVFICLILTTGCVGFIGADLSGVGPNYKIHHCGSSPEKYELEVYTEAEYDYADKNIAGYISFFTLGIIPTYWFSSESSVSQITESGRVVYSRSDESRIHRFYGWLWLFILDRESDNALKSDEGAGIRIPTGIKDRAVVKTLLELPKDIKSEELCLR